MAIIKGKIAGWLSARYPMWTLDTALRYLPIVDTIKSQDIDNPSIVELGSGHLGITPYLKTPVTGVDVGFESDISPLLKPVELSSTKLPFADDEFDFSISSDMLEHLPWSERGAAILEMLRVARSGAILICPMGSRAEKQDRRFAELYRKFNGADYPWLLEHVVNGLPSVEYTRDMIDAAADKTGKTVDVKVFPVLNLHINGFLRQIWVRNNPYTEKLYSYMIVLTHLRRLLNFGPCFRQMFVCTITGSRDGNH